MATITTTPYTDINDLFLQQIDDYRIDKLFIENIDNLNSYLAGFMFLAIPEFIPCSQDLSNRNETLMEFNFVMTDTNKKILSKLMVKEWLSKEVKDILQMRWNITDTDFKHYSEAQNISAKQSILRELMEEVSQLLVSDSYRNNDWDSWIHGNFMGA